MDKDFIEPYFGEIGDCLILTKPIGTQIAVNIHEWRLENDRKYSLLKKRNIINDGQELLAFNIAKASMIRLNKTAAHLMHKYQAKGATDITGFGLLGHISNLSQHQKLKRGTFEFYVHTLPVINAMTNVSDFLAQNNIINFELREGKSAETSGGLLVILRAEFADDFIREIEEIDGWPAWNIGCIRERSGNGDDCVFAQDMNIIQVGQYLISSKI